MSNSNMEANASPNMRMLLVLEALSRSDGPVTIADLSDKIGLPKPTMHRIVKTLLSEGFLEKQGQQIAIGKRTLVLSANMTLKNEGNLVRHTIMQRLASKVQETVNFVVPTETGMVYTDRIETDWHFRVMLPVGTGVPFYCTASGKTYLASLRRSQLVRLCEQITFTPYTHNTITDAHALLENIKQIRRQGYAIDDEELYQDMLAIAVPVFTPQNHYCGALAIHGPKQRFSLDRALASLPELQQASRDICDALFSD